MGANGLGLLTISNRAVVSAGGANDGGTGLVVSEGTGDGSVQIDGGTLSVSDNATVNFRGDITLADGLLSVAGTLTLAGGLEGDGRVDGALDVTGEVVAESGTLELTGPITGNGSLVLGISTPATLRLDGGDANATVDFLGPDGTLDLGAPLETDASLFNFVAGDAITLAGDYATVGLGFAGDTMTVTGDGATIARLNVPLPGLDSANTSVSDVDGVVTITTTLPCFLAGTAILTARGEIPVEDLRVGDLALTLSGHGAPLKPIIWIGRGRFDAARHPRPERVIPIRIAAGALGEGLPHRDLLVSPDHCLCLDGVMIPAERLINGATIVRDASITRGEYFHVELAGHDILLSEGAPSESYLDTGNRGAFVNGGPLPDLHPDFAPRHWTGKCVPLAQEGPVLAAVRSRLIDRARDMGWDRDETPLVTVVADGRVVPPARRDGNRWFFSLPRGAQAVRLRSASGVPAELLPDSPDRRRLGLLIDDLAILRGGRRRRVPLDDRALTDGWHAVERAPHGVWRWTDGDAGLAIKGPCQLELSAGYGVPRWRPSAGERHAGACGRRDAAAHSMLTSLD